MSYPPICIGPHCGIVMPKLSQNAFTQCSHSRLASNTHPNAHVLRLYYQQSRTKIRM